MLRLSRILLGFFIVGVIPLQQSRACWAAETTQRGVMASAFAGAGEIADSNNEGSPDVYDVSRTGLGVAGVLRLGDRDPHAAPVSRYPTGWFALAGAAAELEWTKQTWCGYACDSGNGTQGAVSRPRELASKLAGRLGVGYSFSLVELRVGGLYVLPSSDSSFPESIWSPDVMIRVGRRSLGWFELGLGAYDASTMLRPGAYLGGGGGDVETLRVTGHLGVHVVNGLCCQTLMPFGGIAELDVERAVSPSMIAGVDARLEIKDRVVFGGSLHLAFLL